MGELEGVCLSGVCKVEVTGKGYIWGEFGDSKLLRSIFV